MIYKLINTGEYLLIVNNLDITAKKGYENVIAHLPLNDSPIIKDISLLPPLKPESVWDNGLEEELNKLPYTKHLDDGQYNDGRLTGFELGAKWGFDKAKEKYQYTEEDLRKAIEMARSQYWNVGKVGFSSNTEGEFAFSYNEDEIIKSVSSPKIPTHFEVFSIGSGMFVPKIGDVIYKNNNWEGRYIYK